MLVVLATVALSLAGPAGASGRRLTAADRKTISANINTFVNHAVKRLNPTAAYRVVARGVAHGWTILYVTRDEVAVNLILRPKPGVKMRGILFNLYLRPAHGKWLIDSFMPAATINTELFGNAARVTSVRDFMPGVQSGGPHGKPLVSSAVAYIPFGVLALVLLVLAGALTFGALRYRPRGGSLPPFPTSRRAK